MGLLNKMTTYAKTWEESYRETLAEFSEEDFAGIEEIKVVPADYGKSARVSTKAGFCFFSLSRECGDIPVDTILDKEKCMVVHLKRGSDQTTEKLLYLGEY